MGERIDYRNLASTISINPEGKDEKKIEEEIRRACRREFCDSPHPERKAKKLFPHALSEHQRRERLWAFKGRRGL